MSSCIWAPFLEKCYEYGPIQLSVGDKLFLIFFVSSVVAIIIGELERRGKK